MNVAGKTIFENFCDFVATYLTNPDSIMYYIGHVVNVPCLCVCVCSIAYYSYDSDK